MAKFKVCVTQMVERVAVVEVEADNEIEAMAKAHIQGFDSAQWDEGDDCDSVSVYAVFDASDECVWSR